MQRIFKYKYHALGLLIASAALATALAQDDELPLFTQNWNAAYKVEVTDNGEGWGHGTGEVLTPDGYLITNDHVVVSGSKGIRIRVRTPDKKVLTLDATVVATDPINDLAVIKVAHQFTDTVELEDPALIPPAAKIYSIGFPYSAGKCTDRGEIKQLYLYPDPANSDEPVTDRLYMNIEDGHGTSGSGIYSEKTGRLVGIMQSYTVFARDRSPLFVRKAVPVTKVMEFLDKHHIPYRSAAHRAHGR